MKSNGCHTHKLEGWNYVENQQDIDFILKETRGFHDTVLKDLSYISSSYVNEKKSMYCINSIRQVTMRFDSQFCNAIEMVFEGVVALNLRPAPDNYTSEIFNASLLLRDGIIFFADSRDGITRAYDGTWIEAHGLRWKFCG